MAGKSVKRAKIDAQLSKDVSNGLRMACGSDTEPTRASGNHEDLLTENRQETDVEKLKLELDVATKCIEQLRREKDYEVRRVRDEEQTRLSTSLKDLEARLKAESEKARDAIKSRMEADVTRQAARYERTIKRLSGDLDKCRNELREEVEKRGMSSSTRGGFEAERVRLLTEVRDLKAAKRRLEEKIESAAEVDKQKAAEMKRMQEACRAEVAKVSKEANAEIRKLLDELKAKDHQLALLDRNQYPDRGASLIKQSTVTENQPDGAEVTSSSSLPKPVKPTTPVGEVGGKNNNLETIANLKKDLEKLNEKLSASELERNRLKGRVDELCHELAQRNETIANLRKRDNSASSSDQKQKTQPKLAREIDVTETSPLCEDDNASVTSEMSCSSLSSTSSSVLSPDTTALYDENLEKNYHRLLSEHLNLQRSIAVLLSSWTGSTSPSTASTEQPLVEATPSRKSDEAEKELPTCTQECVIEKDSLKVTIGTLEDKLKQVEQSEERLKQQLHEIKEQSEELEFRVLELEESVEKCKMTHSGNAAEELFEKIRRLEDDLSWSNEKINYYKKLETDFACNDISLGDYIELIKHRQLDAEGRSDMLRFEVMTLKRKLEAPLFQQKIHRAHDVELSPSKSLMTKIDLSASDADCDDLLSVCPMNCSMSTTSGYDDNSCASSVADMRLDDLPSEDEDVTRADDIEEICQSTDSNDITDQTRATSAGAPELGDAGNSTLPPEGYVPAETLKKMEQSWLTRIETMENRLAQAIQSEQRARDQVALLGEEKDRRIVALQKQVDMLEANEFRLAETIQSLERLEMTFSQLTSLSPSSSSESSRNVSVSDEDVPTSAASKTADDTSDKPLDSILQADIFNEHRCTTSGDGCIQCEAGRILKSSLEKLRSAQNESDSLDMRIKELGESENADSDLMPASILLEAAVTDDEFVDFKAEYRELEILVRELKSVLLIDDNRGEEQTEAGKIENDCDQEDYSCGVAMRPVGFPDLMSQSWSTVASENCLYSLPNSPIFEFQPPIVSLLRERCREYELSGQQLAQQVANLERERDSLKEAVDGGEATVRELGIRLLELQASESSLKDEVNRLKTKEDWMSARNDELMELIGRLETTVDQHRAAEVELRSRIDRHTTSQAELGRELEEARDEARAEEARYRRWIGQLEDERATLTSAFDELMERNTDLEGREAGLLCRIRRLEAAEIGLKSDVAELERALNETGSRSFDDAQTVAIQAVFDVEEVSTQTDAESITSDKVGEEHYLQMFERAEFFKEMWEFCEQSNTALENKLKQFTASEEALRDSVKEHENADKLWQGKVENLEERNGSLVEEISDLKLKITDLQTSYDLQQQKTRDDVSDPIPDDDYDFEQSRQNAVSALRTLMLLSDVADDADDTELAYWAAVEGAAATSCDDVTDEDLSSPFWSTVEARMGLKIDEENRESTVSEPSEPDVAQSQNLMQTNGGEPTTTKSDHSPGVSSAQTTLHVAVRSPRSRSADLFVAQSNRVPSGERKQKRSSSESRDTPFNGYAVEYAKGIEGSVSARDYTSSTVDVTVDSVMERIQRSRQFWSTKTSVTPSPSPSQNGRRSLIPRINPATRLQQNSPRPGAEASLSLPVIRSTPLSPQDDRKNKSYLPRPVNDSRPINEGNESIRDQINNTEVKVTKELSGQQTTPKVYTTVLGPNRFTTSPKFSYAGSSSQPPRVGGAGKVTDSTPLTNPHSSKTNQLQRPVVHTFSSSTDVISEPEVETSLLPASCRD